MSESREWISLGEAFDLIVTTPVIKARAKERLPYLTRDFDISDAINLETEDAMSESGLDGGMQFRGMKAKHADPVHIIVWEDTLAVDRRIWRLASQVGTKASPD